MYAVFDETLVTGNEMIDNQHKELIGKIAALEELKAGEEDLNQEYQKIAEQYKMEADKIKELIPAAELEKDICVEKAINLVRDNANIKDAE